MSSWVKVTRGQVQKPIVDKRHRPGWIPRLLDINPYRPYQKSPYSPQDGYSKDFEDLNSFEELFGQQYDYSTGNEDYYERYQYSQKDDDYSRDDRREKLYLQFYQQIQKEYDKERPSDCIIVAISKEQTEYATVIGHRLQDHGLVVEMIYLTSELGLTRALQEVKNDGSPFCILVEQSNVALSSCTVIMLHESIKTLVEQTDPSTEVEDTLYQANVMPSTSTATHTLSKPPPLLPTPNRNVLLGQSPLPPAKPALLGDRPSGALLPTPGMSGAKGKPPPLLAAPAKRPGLLGYSPHQPAKRPLLGEKPGLLPTPAVHVKPVQHQRAAKPKPLLN
ncbi:uncharacterized protein LOC101951213 isoform X9 [Chrysemys picta bellii]|uniref:uncharacterized protein LOC101951213 isoform X9 n=1 Tax=Chrysemys picta bellii TaxID=8478 RepID=UPI0032B195D6